MESDKTITERLDSINSDPRKKAMLDQFKKEMAEHGLSFEDFVEAIKKDEK